MGVDHGDQMQPRRVQLALRVSPAFVELVNGVTDKVVQIDGKRGYNFVTTFTNNLDHFMF